MDFAIKYEGHGYGREASICNVLITKSDSNYHFKSIERYYTYYNQKFDTIKKEGEISQLEIEDIIKKINTAKLPVSIPSYCMHTSRFEIQVKDHDTFWWSSWCKPQHKNLVHDKAKLIENAILESVAIYPTQVSASLIKIKETDSVGFEIFATSGFKFDGLKCLFDSRSLSINLDGICELQLHKKDTSEWMRRLTLFEIRKDMTLHEITSPVRINN